MKDAERRRELDLEELVAGIQGRDRRALARVITLIESRRGDRAELGQRVLERVLPLAGGAIRVGVSGMPGVGKSTLIDALGMRLLERGLSVAVLAVDPTSVVSGGSILGDKSRMSRLAADERAFIRPSPTARDLGGVTRRTAESVLLCEAAGFDVVLVETVGVGQSEVDVAELVDFFLVLLLPGAGDELQGIKKGIIELADAIAINKADGEREDEARRTRNEYAAALGYLDPGDGAWRTEVLTISARSGQGVDELWDLIERHRQAAAAAGALAARRREQQRRWLWRLVEEGLLERFRADPAVAARLGPLERDVLDGRKTAAQAAEELLALTRPN
jgi:LAO/AO transport system kinase